MLDDRKIEKGYMRYGYGLLSHPAACTCVDCSQKRLERTKKAQVGNWRLSDIKPRLVGTLPDKCPACDEPLLLWNRKTQQNECHNPACKYKGPINAQERPFTDSSASMNKAEKLRNGLRTYFGLHR